MEEVEQLNYVHKLIFYKSSNHGRDDFSVTEQVFAFQKLSFKKNLTSRICTCAQSPSKTLIEEEESLQF